MSLYLIFAQLDKNQITGLPSASGDTAIKTILHIVFAVTGAIALLVITIAGLRYITSQGDPNTVAQAKDTIIYALVGLIVSILAFTIVSFVVKGVG